MGRVSGAFAGLAYVTMLALSLVALVFPATAQTALLAERARSSTVYIFFDITDPKSGAKSTVQGTGFIISPSGYVLTASHLFRDWKAQIDIDRAKNPIRATLNDKVGFTTGAALILSLITLGDPDAEDIALLKLPFTSSAYPAAPICFQHEAKLGEELVAFGFPLNQNFQPVPGMLGTQNGPGGRWTAASAFTYGMSGGPVYDRETDSSSAS
jgi:S1-C subfamily serine protease